MGKRCFGRGPGQQGWYGRFQGEEKNLIRAKFHWGDMDFFFAERGLESSQERWLSVCFLMFGWLSLFWKVNSYHLKHKYIWMYLGGCVSFFQPSRSKSRKSKKDRWYANTQMLRRFCWMYAIATPLKQAACWTDLIQNWIWGNFSGRTIY